jgi:hypothetical protein
MRRLAPAFAALVLAATAVAAAGCTIRAGSAEPGASGSTAVTPLPAGAGTQLAALTVAKPRPMAGYSREKFPHWAPQGANCDVRDVVLKRDGTDVRVGGECNVVAGRWLSVYDNKTVTEPEQIDIDHMVPLANAWRSGADTWSEEQRTVFANDLGQPQLIAVSRTSNRAKGDQDPAQWKPPNRAFWCTYAQRWIAVKHHYRLTVTEAEKSALEEMLRTCEQRSSASPT